MISLTAEWYKSEPEVIAGYYLSSLVDRREFAASFVRHIQFCMIAFLSFEDSRAWCIKCKNNCCNIHPLTHSDICNASSRIFNTHFLSTVPNGFDLDCFSQRRQDRARLMMTVSSTKKYTTCPSIARTFPAWYPGPAAPELVEELSVLA